MGNTCISQNFTSEEESHLQIACSRGGEDLQSFEIKVLSYNIFIRPPPVHTNGDDYKDERLAEFLKHISGYHVICLQEMFGAYSNRRSNLIESAKKLGFLYSYKSPKQDFFSTHFLDGGLLILSRFPIVTQEFCPFAPGIGSDYVVQKGVLYVKIAIGTSYLHLYNTHTQATYEDDIKYFLKRSEQFLTFQQFIKESLKKNDYNETDVVLLTGDFNVDSRSLGRIKSEAIKSTPKLQDMSNLTKKETFSEYDGLVSCLSDDHQDEIVDLVYNKFKEHPATFGEYVIDVHQEKRPLERVLTHPEYQCSSECLDYIFKYTPRPDNSSSIVQLVRKQNAKAELAVKDDSAKIAKFFVHGHDFDQLSDHYGIEVSLQYTRVAVAEKEDSESTASGSGF